MKLNTSIVAITLAFAASSAHAFDASKIKVSLACHPGDTCIWNLEVPESDPIASFHLKMKGDPKLIKLTAPLQASWTETGIEDGGIYIQDPGTDNTWGEIRISAPINKADIISWSYDYKDGNGKTITVPSVPEPATYAMMLAGIGLISFLRSRRRVV